MNIKLKNELIKQLQVNVSVKTLGVHINPRLNWNDEFEYVRKKMIVTIRKLMRTEMKTYQAHMYYNVYMLTNVFFGCGIVQFNAKQIKELKRIYELPMIRKLGLGDNFLENCCMCRNQG